MKNVHSKTSWDPLQIYFPLFFFVPLRLLRRGLFCFTSWWIHVYSAIFPPCYLPAVSLIGTNHHPLRVNNICFFFILSYLQVSCLDFIHSSSFFLFFFSPVPKYKKTGSLACRVTTKQLPRWSQKLAPCNACAHGASSIFLFSLTLHHQSGASSILMLFFFLYLRRWCGLSRHFFFFFW